MYTHPNFTRVLARQKQAKLRAEARVYRQYRPERPRVRRSG